MEPRSQERFSALYVRDFRIFWVGQVISFSGTWMQSVAQGWLVYSITRSPVHLGIVAAAASLPVLLFTLVGGVVADRVPRKNLLILTQCLSMIPALLLGILAELRVVTVWQIAALAFFLGTVNAFDVPARQSFLSEMVQKGRLMNAIALNAAAFNGARIIGPIAAGLAIAAVGVAACFYINAASFLAAIIALSRIKGRREEPAGARQRVTFPLILRDLGEGLRYVRSEQDVFRIMLLVATFSLFGIPFVTFLPVFAEDVLRVGPQGLGFLAGSSGTGALAAALIIAFVGEIRLKGRFMSAAGIVFAASLILFSLSGSYALSLGLLALSGWGIVSFLATGNSFIQLSVPDVLRGRVMSIYALVFLGVAPVGSYIIGHLAAAVGTPGAVTAGAAVCLLAMVSLSGHLRLLDRTARPGATTDNGRGSSEDQ